MSFREPVIGTSAIRCDCGARAVCFGAYEDPIQICGACDECCGHGNEDGWCVPLDADADLPAMAASHIAHARENGRYDDDDDIGIEVNAVAAWALFLAWVCADTLDPPHRSDACATGGDPCFATCCLPAPKDEAADV